MKSKPFKQLLVLGAILCCQNTFGQLPSIDSVKLIPQNPISTDEIQLICYATFASGGCDLQDHLVSISGNQITLSLEYTPGMATYICHAVDTISLGYLMAGNYETDINLILTPQDAIADHEELNFFVGTQLGTNESSDDFQVAIQPNPFEQGFRIETNARIEKMELFTVSGQKINKEFSLQSAKGMDLSDLKDGIYLLTLTDQNGNRHSQRIIKNNFSIIK